MFKIRAFAVLLLALPLLLLFASCSDETPTKPQPEGDETCAYSKPHPGLLGIILEVLGSRIRSSYFHPTRRARIF